MRTVKEISDLTGISVRTLHYYDEIGLLKPTEKSDAGYRLYDDKALETLQQLAKGKSVPLAVESAKAYVTMAIEHSLAIGKGCGPTHHFYELYQHGLSKE